MHRLLITSIHYSISIIFRLEQSITLRSKMRYNKVMQALCILVPIQLQANALIAQCVIQYKENHWR